MNFSVLTYNTLFNKAYQKIGVIIEKEHPDIICLQEVNTSESNLLSLESKGYKLADYSNSFIQFNNIFGVATYYNPKRFSLIDSEPINLNKSIPEIFFLTFKLALGINQPRTILRTNFYDKVGHKKISVYNVHLLLFATNSIRINHIRGILDSLKLDKTLSIIICGDFNYFPYSRKKLEKITQEYGLKEATKSLTLPSVKFTSDGKYEQFNFIQRLLMKIINRTIANRLKLDYIFYRKLRLKQVLKLDLHFSDHLPIISRFFC